MMRNATILSISMLFATPLCATPALAPDTTAVIRLVDDFITAEKSFDQATLARLTTPDYVEISPVGELDTREKMLSFYAPEKKQPAPPLTFTERNVRVTGAVAIVNARLTYGTASVQATYVARRDGGTWRLMSTQLTPIRVSRAS